METNKQRTELRKFTAPRGVTISQRKLPVGTYAAFVYDMRRKNTQYGEQVNLFYLIHATGIPNVPNDVFGFDELVSEFYTPKAKFGRRLAAMNGYAELPDDTPVDTLEFTGPVLVQMGENADGYNKITEVYPIRTTDPRYRALVECFNRVHPEGWELHSVVNPDTDTSEVPF